MILAVDVFYNIDNIAKIVGVLFENWDDPTPKETVIDYLENIAPYEPGSFYKRELPCILKLLFRITIEIDCIIINGYVYLNDDNKKGLGAYLYDSLENKIPIIGVAKTSFHDNKNNVVEVFRGKSEKPLYISAIGTDKNQAAQYIKEMHGEFRFPSLLKQLDQETKKTL
ncbi:endonuclease V [Chryseobacterium sp.]|uniref:endonuclease V n=1 Tax=Chryseobacterium sp. TaxID=1871047 RepID=UPI003890DCF4